MKYFPLYILVLLLIGCSATQVTQNTNNTVQLKIQKNSNENLAINHVVNGSVAELEGDYKTAITEFERALKVDPQSSIYYIIGKNYMKINKLSTALRYAKQAVQLSPDEIEYKFLLGHIYQTARMADSAAMVFNDIIRLDSTNIQAHYSLGNIIENDRPTDALRLYKRILDITGPEWQVLVKIADINERLGNVNETIKTVEELAELNPSSLDLQKILVESYIKADKLDKALDVVDEALLLFPNDLTLIEYKANVHVIRKEWDKAAKEYIKIINSKDIPHQVKLTIGTAFLNEASKDSTVISVAKEVFREISRDSLDWQANVYLGELAILENNDSLAISYFDNAVLQAEWNARIWIRYGGLLFDNAKYDKAIESMQRALVNFPDEFVLNLVLGLSYSQKSMHKEAKISLLKCYELNSQDLTTLSSLGFTLNQLHENDEALKYLNNALQLDGENIQILGLLGLIYDDKKMYEQCDSVYSKALEIDSSNAFILNNYAYSLAERGHKLDEALQMSTTAVEQEPENSSYLDTIGWIYFKLGEYEKAKGYIQKAVDIDADNAVQKDHLGDVFYRLSDKPKAMQLWQEALKLDDSIENLKEKIEKGEL